eukprot:763670-Hanusia_phi.AAC.3
MQIGFTRGQACHVGVVVEVKCESENSSEDAVNHPRSLSSFSLHCPAPRLPLLSFTPQVLILQWLRASQIWIQSKFQRDKDVALRHRIDCELLLLLSLRSIPADLPPHVFDIAGGGPFVYFFRRKV